MPRPDYYQSGRKIARVLGLTIQVTLNTLVFQLAWNYVVVAATGFNTISFWQAFVIGTVMITAPLIGARSKQCPLANIVQTLHTEQKTQGRKGSGGIQ